MKKSLLLIVFLLMLTPSFSQIQIKGTLLVGSDKKPIPFANIGILNSPIGSISNKDGSFSLSIPYSYLNDSLTFSSIGFSRFVIPIAEIDTSENYTINLKEKITRIGEVLVEAKKEKNKNFWLGNKHADGGLIYADSVVAGSALALLIENKQHDVSFPVYLITARLKIAQNSMDDFKVRVRIVEVDSSNHNLPGEDLLEESIVVATNKTGGWINFDLSKYNFKTNVPFFLMFEWIMEDKDRLELSNQYKEYLKLNPEKIRIDSTQVNGEQVLFYNWGTFSAGTPFAASFRQFTMDNFTCYYRMNSFGEWHVAPAVLTARLLVSTQPISNLPASNEFDFQIATGKPPIIFDNIHLRFDNSRVTDQQKVYLHLDRPYYVSGETIWFKAYVVKAARNQYDYRSGVLTVEVIEPEGAVIISNRLKLTGGITSGSISLPDTLKTAQYVLRAYTNWMRNFDPSFYWTKPIKITGISELENVNTPQIEPASDTTLLAFYPEGGYLLNGIPCQIGFKASNIIGQPVDVSGKIVDSNGVKVASFSSIHQGMGSFFFTPYEGNDYFAVLNNIPYPLPKALSSGLVMFAYSENLSTIRVSIQGSKSFDGQYFHLLGQNNGVIQYSATGKLRDNKALAIINTEGLPPGILQLTLFDQFGRPQAERLLFVQPKERPGMEIVVNRVGCEPRQKIDVEIELLDNKNKGIESELSIAITDPSQVQIPIYGNNIYSHFYLTSDLEGNVPTPGFYLKDQTKQTQRALDVLLLTHGWRRFRWKDILESSGALQYGFQAGITISGKALNKSSNKPIVEGVVSLIALDHNNSIHQGFTDAEGRFKFDGLDIRKDSWGVIKVKNDKGKSYPSIIILDSQTESAVIPLNYPHRIDHSPSQSFLKHAATRRQIDLAFDTTGVEYLDSVVIRAERPNYLAVRRLHFVADAVIKNDRPTYGTIFDLLRGKVAGLQLINRNGITHISIRNLPTPLVLLNGVPLNIVSLGSGEPEDLYYALLSVDPTDVERIEILKTQATASIYGLQGTNGVIAIYTKGESDVISKPPNFSRVKLPGYFREREFYSPNYHGNLKNNPKPDHRATLHWQSSVQTDNTGKVNFSFFNSDVACNLDFVVEGLSKDGQPIYFYEQQ